MEPTIKPGRHLLEVSRQKLLAELKQSLGGFFAIAVLGGDIH
jgi:hypothetical protein